MHVIPAYTQVLAYARGTNSVQYLLYNHTTVFDTIQMHFGLNPHPRTKI